MQKFLLASILVVFSIVACLSWSSGLAQPSDSKLDLRLRSINLAGEKKPVGGRMCGIAAEIVRSNRFGWTGIDFIALQEVVDGKKCPIKPQGGTTSAHCLAAALTHGCGINSTLRQTFSTVYKGGNLAILVDSAWEVVSSQIHELGNDNCTSLDHLLGRDKRYALEVVAWNRRIGATVRIYNAHLSHISTDCGSQVEQRRKQLAKLVLLAGAGSRPGQFPPIIVGDLNFYPHDEEQNYGILASNFDLAADNPGTITGVAYRKDHIWLGRSSAFSNSRAWVHWLPTPDVSLSGQRTINWRVSFNRQGCLDRDGCEKSWSGELTDHDSPGIGIDLGEQQVGFHPNHPPFEHPCNQSNCNGPCCASPRICHRECINNTCSCVAD